PRSTGAGRDGVGRVPPGFGVGVVGRAFGAGAGFRRAGSPVFLVRVRSRAEPAAFIRRLNIDMLGPYVRRALRSVAIGVRAGHTWPGCVARPPRLRGLSRPLPEGAHV